MSQLLSMSLGIHSTEKGCALVYANMQCILFRYAFILGTITEWANSICISYCMEYKMHLTITSLCHPADKSCVQKQIFRDIYCIYIVALWFHCLNSFDFRASDRSCLLLGPAQRYPDGGSPKTSRAERKNLPSSLAAPENSSWRTDEEHGSMYSAVTVNKPTLQTYLRELQIYGEKLGEAGIMPPKSK